MLSNSGQGGPTLTECFPLLYYCGCILKSPNTISDQRPAYYREFTARTKLQECQRAKETIGFILSIATQGAHTGRYRTGRYHTGRYHTPLAIAVVILPGTRLRVGVEHPGAGIKIRHRTASYPLLGAHIPAWTSGPQRDIDARRGSLRRCHATASLRYSKHQVGCSRG